MFSTLFPVKTNRSENRIFESRIMRRTEPTVLNTLLKELLSDKNTFSKGLVEGKVLNSWRDVVGPYLADSTSKLTLRDGVIYASFSSAAAANDFFVRRTSILAALNKIAGFKLIRFIHVSLG